MEDYVTKLKKKFSDYGKMDEGVESMRKNLGVLPDDEVRLLKEAYPTNIHVNTEWKRRGLDKKK